tara:strand:- start:313 stop:675 length:363 start_codon:yes stop_codon:yes gene_type:complete
MDIKKTTGKQINLCNKQEKYILSSCMEIKVRYIREDNDCEIMPIITSEFIDNALDPIEIYFDSDMIEINTKNYSHIDLTKKHILFLLKFYEYSKKLEYKFDNMTEEQHKSFEKKHKVEII